MKQYLDLAEQILNRGELKTNRMDIKTKSIFGYMLRFDLQKGFPLVTTKRVIFSKVFHELIFFLKGKKNVSYLREHKVKIWEPWTVNDEIGPLYGYQWRKWPTKQGTTIDQIAYAIDLIKNSPNSRRILVNAWNTEFLPKEDVSYEENIKQGKMVLAPCHVLFHFYIQKQKYLSCLLYQRSADVFLGVPFNIASYSLLTHLIAKVTGLSVGEFVWVGGDCHIYENHFHLMRQQIKRECFKLPTLQVLKTRDKLEDYTLEDLLLENYKHHPTIKGLVAA